MWCVVGLKFSCIERDFVCNNVADCPDGVDEDPTFCSDCLEGEVKCPGGGACHFTYCLYQLNPQMHTDATLNKMKFNLIKLIRTRA